MSRKTWVVLAIALLLSVVAVQRRVFAQTAAPPALASEVSVDTGNGFGSTGAYTMTFANVDANVGAAITYASDATNGDTFTINTDGVYAISYSDGAAVNPGDIIGITLNGSASTAFASQAAGSRLCTQSMPNGYTANCSVTIILARNDVIRAQRSLATAGTSTNSAARFIITKVN